MTMKLGIPYGVSKGVTSDGELIGCPWCDAVIVCAERKDSESFSHREYSNHLEFEHAQRFEQWRKGDDHAGSFDRNAYTITITTDAERVVGAWFNDLADRGLGLLAAAMRITESLNTFPPLT